MAKNATAKNTDLSVAKVATPPGGGAFKLDDLAVGIFLTDQVEHRISLGSDRTEAKPLKAGEGWVLPAGSEGLCSYENNHHFIFASIPAHFLAEAGFNAHAVKPQFGTVDPLVSMLATQAAGFDASAGRLYRDTLNRALVAQLVQSTQPTDAVAAQTDDQRIRRALAYMREHLAEDIAMAELASEAAMSEFHFARAFKQSIGNSPLQQLITERIDAAKVMLRTTKLAVGEIAHRVGYEDVSRFGQHFKRATGATPAAFRAG
jgi:AraC family transcriptional regulator